MLLVIKKFKSGIMLFSVNYVSPGNILSVLERWIEFLKVYNYAMLFEMQCNALWVVCSVCWGKGSPMQKL